MTTTIVTRAEKGSSLDWTEIDANFTNLRVNLDAISSIVGASGLAKIYATWAKLAAATGMAAGDAAVIFEDSGTHTDPVVGGTVSNTGVFIYSASPAGWERVASTEGLKAQDARVAAEAARDAALAAPLSPVAAAHNQAIGERIDTLTGATDFLRTGMVLDFITPYLRTAATTAASLAALGIATVTQAGTLWAQKADGTFQSFAANTARVTTKGWLVEAAATNKALRSEELDNAAWTKSGLTVTANAGTSTSGANTADKIIPSTANATHVIYQTTGTANGGDSRTLQCEVEANGYTQVRLRLAANGQGFQAIFDLSAGTLVSSTGFSGGAAPVSYEIVLLGGGRYLISISGTFSGTFSAANVQTSIWVINGGNETFAGDGTSGINVCRVQTEDGLTRTSYVATTSATVTRAADAATLTLPAGASDDVIEVTYGPNALVKSIARSALGSSTTLNLVSDGGGVWLNSYITKIELMSAASYRARNVGRLKYAVRNYGFYPRPAAELAAGDTPTLALSAAGATSTINSVAATAPTISRTSLLLSYVSGPPVQYASDYPGQYFYTARGAYYGTSDGTTPLRGRSYFAFEFVHTGTTFEIPVLGAGATTTNFRVIVNGKVAGTLTVPGSTGSLYFAKITFPGSGTRTIRIETNGIPMNGVNVASASEVASVGRELPIMTMISDSWWEGTGSEVGDIQSVVMARALGMAPALAAVGGTGLLYPGGNNTSGYPKVNWFNSNRITDLTLSGITDPRTGLPVVPAVGVIGGSMNDQGISSTYWSSYGASLQAAITNRASYLIDQWQAVHPYKPLVFFGPEWPSGLPNNRPVLDIYRIRDGYAEAVFGRSGGLVHFIDRMLPNVREGIYSTTTDNAYLYTGGTSGTDSSHPTPAGHRLDGLWMANQMRALVLGQMA